MSASRHVDQKDLVRDLEEKAKLHHEQPESSEDEEEDEQKNNAVDGEGKKKKKKKKKNKNKTSSSSSSSDSIQSTPKDGRPPLAQLRGLVERLSSPHSLITRAQAIAKLLTFFTSSSPTTPAQPIHPSIVPTLISLDIIPPLLFLAQLPPRDPITLAPPKDLPPAVADAADAALMLLDCLCSESMRRLRRAGWELVQVETDPKAKTKANEEKTAETTPTPLFRNLRTGGYRRAPPDMAALATIYPDEPTWISSLLAELPLLIQPKLEKGQLVWPVSIRLHHPAQTVTLKQSQPTTGEVSSTAAVTSSQQQLSLSNMSVVDVWDDFSSEAPIFPKPGAEPRDEDEDYQPGMRQLVMGVWEGIGEAFRESEVDITHPPGSHLENWYTCTMAGMALLAAQFEKKTAATTQAAPRVLLVGLGGGVLYTFLNRHFPHLSLSAVEIDPRVVMAATRYFGVKGKIVSSGEYSSVTQADEKAIKNMQKAAIPHQELHEEFIHAAQAKDHPPTSAHSQLKDDAFPHGNIYISDAMDFLNGKYHDNKPISSTFDVILLDVYTNAVFPQSLLNHKFFQALKNALTPQGTLICNAGINTTQEQVLQLTKETWNTSSSNNNSSTENVYLLLDRDRFSPASDALQENGVLLAGYLVQEASSKLTLNHWRRQSSAAMTYLSSVNNNASSSSSSLSCPFELEAAEAWTRRKHHKYNPNAPVCLISWTAAAEHAVESEESSQSEQQATAAAPKKGRRPTRKPKMSPSTSSTSSSTTSTSSSLSTSSTSDVPSAAAVDTSTSPVVSDESESTSEVGSAVTPSTQKGTTKADDPAWSLFD